MWLLDEDVTLVDAALTAIECRISTVKASGGDRCAWRRIHQLSIDDHGTRG
jgi:hypothetical protein